MANQGWKVIITIQWRLEMNEKLYKTFEDFISKFHLAAVQSSIIHVCAVAFQLPGISYRPLNGLCTTTCVSPC
jgi:hypothetical protein